MKIKYFLLYLLLPIIFIGIILESSYFFLKSDYFKVEWVGIKGKDNLVKSDISNKMKALKGKIIWSVDCEKLEREILKDIRIKSVNIKKEYPDIIDIELELREAYVYINRNDKIYLADKEGLLYGYRSESEKFDMVSISLDSDSEIKKIYEIMDLMGSEFLMMVSEIFYYKNETEAYYKLILKSGIYIKTDEDVSKEKYSIGYKAYLKLFNLGEIREYIDLRFNEDIYTVK